MVNPKLERGVFYWTSGAAVDADGAYNAYRLDDTGLDDIRNARNKAGEWVGVETDTGEPDGKPIQQGEGDPEPGALVSPTSMRDKTKKRTDPTAYVDAATRAYLAICPELRAQGVKFGDLAIAEYQGRRVALICADGCPHNHYGEVSIAAAAALGFSSSPRRGGVSSGVTFYVFPGSASAPAWPRAADDVEATARRLFDAWRASAPAVA